MILFHYKAKNKDAQTIIGKIEAGSKEEAIEKITKFGLTPVALEEARPGEPNPFSVSSKRPAAAVPSRVMGRVKLKELYYFSRQFASLLRSGIVILHALNVLAKQTKNLYFQRVITQICEDVQGGKSFSDSAAQYPKVFPPIFIRMSRAGEEGGKLQEVIAGIAEYLKAQMEIRNKIKMALVYPAMMLILGIGAVVFILTAVMPKITKIFIQNEQKLPLPTEIIIKISNLLIHQWAWICLIILTVILLVKRWLATPQGERGFWQMRLQFPVLGELWLKEDLARFSRTMALLMGSGVSIITAMKFSIPTVSNIFLREQLEKCQEELVAGHSLGEQIRQMSLLPDLMGDLIAVGEEAGSLVPSLNDIAENYEQEINDYVKVMTTLFEPMMIVIVGSLIGFVVIAMLMPIFQMDTM